jgi:copper transport protein
MSTFPGGRRPRDAAGRGRLLPRLALVLVAVAGAALAGPAPTAQAHAFLAASNPADGQVLAASPSALRLDFSESVVLGATKIDIVNGAGRHITPTGLKLLTRGDAGDTETPVEVVATLPNLAHSSYRVSWETLSSDDLHSTRGVLVFGVGQTVTAGGLDEPSPSPLESGLRWLILLGLSGALGGALAIRLLDRAGGPIAGRAGLLARRLSVRGALTGAAAALILLVSQLATSGAGVMALLWSSYGARWGLREAGLLLLALSATKRARALPAGPGRLLLAAGAALACGGTALLGHSGSGATPHITRVIASAAHLGAASTWAGCLVVLAFVLVLHRRDGVPSSDLARTALRGFGPPAAVCVAVLVVTGVYLSSKVIGSVDAALFTIYGRTLLAKVMLAGLAGALALATTLRLHRRGPRATPRRFVMAEAVTAMGILALAGVLTSAQPAMEPQLVQTSTSAASTIADGSVRDLQEELSISPNMPGPSVVLVGVFETRRPAPAPVSGVQVSILGPSGRGEPQIAEHLSNGTWSLSTRLVDSGPVRVKVLVRRDGLPDATRSFIWTIGGGQIHPRAAVVSTAPIGGLLETASAALLFIVFSAVTPWVLVPRIRRRRWNSLRPGADPYEVQIADAAVHHLSAR